MLNAQNSGMEKTVTVETPGQLASLLTASEKDDITSLTVSGNLNDDDLRLLRYMAGRDEYGNITPGSLANLDMLNANIVSGGNKGYYVNENGDWSWNGENSFNYRLFKDCHSIQSIILPSSVKWLSSEVFSGCTRLESVRLPEGLERIEWGAFYNCSKLNDINLPSSLRNIATNVFYNCRNLKSIDLSNIVNISMIPGWTFQSSGLTTITIPSNILTIGEGAFDNSKLTSVVFAENSRLKSLGNNSFSNCFDLKTIVIPDSVTSIGNYCFGGSRSLSTVSLSDNSNLVSIGNNAFEGCPLQAFTVPKRVKIMGAQNFSEYLTSLSVAPGNNAIIYSQGIMYCTDGTLIYIDHNSKILNIPESIMMSLNGATRYNGNLETVIIPSSVEDWGDSPFDGDYNLKELYCLSNNPPTVRYLTGGTSGQFTVYVPFGSKATYMALDEWKYLNIVELPAQPEIRLSESALSLGNVKGMKATASLSAEIVTPTGFAEAEVTWSSSDPNVANISSEGVVTILDKSGTTTISATAVVGNETITAHCNVKVSIFDDSDNLYYLTAENSLRSLIGDNNKYNVEKLVLMGQLSDDDRNFIREMASNHWEGNKEVVGSLKHIDMSELSDTVIWSGAFSNCGSLEIVILPMNVKKLDNSAFAACTNITSLNIPDGVKEIGPDVFYGCIGLKSLKFEGNTAPQITEDVFRGIQSNCCIVVPANASGYETDDYWKDLQNVYRVDELPLLVMDKNTVELYTVQEGGANSEQLYAYAITADGIVTTGINWNSSNEAVVHISENGLISSVGIGGNSIITATYVVNNTEVSSECIVNVIDASGYRFVNVAKAGELSKLLSEDEIYDSKKLIVTGELNNDDIRVLRYMAGRDEYGNLTVGSLEFLDMGKARIVSGGKDGYYYRDNWWRAVSDNYFSSDIFRECNSLKKVILPTSLYNLESYAFSGCQNLEEVVLPEGLTNVGYDSFRECHKLSKINIPSSVTNIYGGAFYGCQSLKSIDLSTMTGVSTIPYDMFGNTGLTSIVIPANITNIGERAFQGTPLKTVVFEAGSRLATISECAFQSTQLQSITIPASVTTINNYAFSDCRSLSAVNYEDNNKLTSLGENVFNGCPIQTFLIPKRLIYMGHQDFSESLSQIEVEEGNKYFEMSDGVLYSKAENALVYAPKNQTSIYLPDYVTSIKNGALRYHYDLTTLVLTSTITDLGESPFCENSNLKEIYCMNPEPPVVQNLTNGWYGTVYIPTGSKKDYEDAKWESSMLEERVFDYSITLSTSSIKLYNVTGGKDRELSAMVFTPAGPFKSEIVWSCSDPTVVSVSNTGVIHYINEGEAIITASAVFADTIISAECRVNNLNFDVNSDVYYVTAGNLSTLIPESKKYEIRDLILLGEINADDIRFIREMAGVDNNNNKTNGKLARLNLEAVNVVHGGSYWSRFWGEQYNDGNTLGGYVFADCSALEEVILPSNLTGLNEGVFYECKNLKYATLPSLINTIPSNTFYNCISLTNVYIPEKVNTIGYNAFAYCTSLKSVISLCNTPASIDWSVFDGLTKGNIALLVPGGTYNAYSGNDDWKGFKSITEMEQLPMIILGYNFVNLYNFNTIGAADRKIPVTVITKYGVSDVAVTWSSSNPDVVTVNNGHVAMTSVSGTSVITATATVDGVTLTASCNVTTNVIDADNAYYVEAGNLPNLIPESQKDSIKKLVLFGELNGSDIRFIREMAGIPEYYWDNPKDGALEYLDISNATIVSGGREYGYIERISNENGDWTSDWGYTENNVIGNGMFRRSNSLKTIVLPRNIEKIGSYAFYECSKLDEIFNLPSTVNELSSRALYGFDVIYTQNEVPIELENNSLLQDGCVIVVPAASIDSYRTADNWKEFKTQIIPDNIQTSVILNVTAEDSYPGLLTAAGGDENLAYIMDLTLNGTINGYDIAIIRNRMPILRNLDLSNVKIIANPFPYWGNDSYTENNRLGSNAFRELNKLRRVVLPKSIDYIGDGAFYHCENLMSVKMYEGVNTIGNDVFAECRNLVDVDMPEGLLSIGNYALRDCGKIEEITIPSSVLSMGWGVFQNCYSLKSIILPRNMARIEGSSFWNCTNLENVILPSKVNRIENEAFYGCSKLKELRLPPMIESIGDRAFYECNNIKDVYVYIANSKDISIDMYTFSCWTTATLHIPTFSYESYYLAKGWMQFYDKKECQETYDEFYTKNTLLLNNNTGTIYGNPDATLYEQGGLVVSDVEQELGNVELISDATTDVTNGASIISGNNGNIKANKLTIRIKVAQHKWHFFCFPFDIQLDSIQYDGEYVWRQYDGYKRSRHDGGWQDLDENVKKLHKGRGYIFQGTVDGELVMTVNAPDLSAKDETTTLFSYESENPSDASWNFVGNPYTSYYNIDDAAYDAPITVWTGNGYEAYRPGDDDYAFYPYQAFFVQAPADGSSINFSTDGRDTYDGAMQKVAAGVARRASARVNPDRMLVNLNIKALGDSTYTDKTRVVFNNNHTMDYELGCDAAKFFSENRSIEIYTLDNEGTKYSINERPVADGTVMMSISVNKTGMYGISASRMDTPITIEDKLTGDMFDLSQGEYVFSAKQGESNRFVLHATGGIVSSVKNVGNNKNERKNDIFNLSGTRISETDANGIIIINNEKVLVK